VLYKIIRRDAKMGIRLKIEGKDNIQLDEHNLQRCVFMTDTPDDSNARSTDVVNTILLTGKILTAIDGMSADDTQKIAEWSLVRAEEADSYRRVAVENIYADQVVRKYILPNAFVVDYEEIYGDTEGVGTFKLTVRQKKDLFDYTEIHGGFGV